MVPTQITSTPIIGSHGHVVGCKTTLTDISALKRAQEVLQFLGEASTILASSFDYPVTAADVIRLAVPLLADVRDPGHLRQRPACSNGSRSPPRTAPGALLAGTARGAAHRAVRARRWVGS